MSNTVKIQLPTRTLSIDISSTPAVPRDALRDYIERHAASPIFNYLGYWKYTFDLISDPILIDDKQYVLHASYGGNAYHIYKFVPQSATLLGDKLEKLSLHVKE